MPDAIARNLLRNIVILGARSPYSDGGRAISQKEATQLIDHLGANFPRKEVVESICELRLFPPAARGGLTLQDFTRLHAATATARFVQALPAIRSFPAPLDDETLSALAAPDRDMYKEAALTLSTRYKVATYSDEIDEETMNDAITRMRALNRIATRLAIQQQDIDASRQDPERLPRTRGYQALRDQLWAQACEI